ncbi:hypothetical protein BV898_00278 [Hypsibius exemplaris]|uniref:Uncharacterized protein n=1 Tax=Hypsibius exemplaris TaxID=2072580 RepID=A0A1W0XFA3_HYPEX|nr:hypothetical protein BV898_00278 [Hypsibius exemplaris]
MAGSQPSLQEAWSKTLRQVFQQRQSSFNTLFHNLDNNSDLRAIAEAVQRVTNMLSTAHKLLNGFPYPLFSQLVKDTTAFITKLVHFDLELREQFNEILFALADEELLVTKLMEIAARLASTKIVSVSTEAWLEGKRGEFALLVEGLQACWFGRHVQSRSEFAVNRTTKYVLCLAFNMNALRDPFIHFASPTDCGEIDVSTCYWFY